MEKRSDASSEGCGEIDMSAGAILQRLNEVEQLHELGMYLTQAHEPIVEDTEDATPFDTESMEGHGLSTQ